MAIHHSQIKKAEKLGFTMEETEIGVRAFWPKRALQVFGASGADAMAQMQAAIAIYTQHDDIRLLTDVHEPRLAWFNREDGLRLLGSPMPPEAAHSLLRTGKAEWIDPVEMIGEPGDFEDDIENADVTKNLGDELTKEQPVPADKPIERINGVAIDGGIAYKEKTPAGDCPYNSEDEDQYDDFVRWNEEWDAAADEATDEEGTGGTVVAEKFRARYSEAGHPTHCGDWLAETLNGIVLNKAGTNIELFEAIANLNGVDLSKYKREGRGWEGRLRMTGRNLMAKRVFTNGGKLALPETLGSVRQAPEEWMAAMGKRYKSKPAEQTK